MWKSDNIITTTIWQIIIAGITIRLMMCKTAMSILGTSTHTVVTSLFVGAMTTYLTLKYTETISNSPNVMWLVGVGYRI